MGIDSEFLSVLRVAGSAWLAWFINNPNKHKLFKLIDNAVFIMIPDDGDEGGMQLLSLPAE